MSRARKKYRRASPLATMTIYRPDEVEFIRAMERFQIKNRKRYPDCRDVLEVAKGLGYRKVS